MSEDEFITFDVILEQLKSSPCTILLNYLHSQRQKGALTTEQENEIANILDVWKSLLSLESRIKLLPPPSRDVADSPLTTPQTAHGLFTISNTTTSAGSTLFGVGSSCYNGASSNITLNKPTDVISGNVLIAAISQNASAKLTPPTGFSLISSNNTLTGPASHIYYKITGETEPSSYTWSFDVGTYPSGVITNFTGSFCSNPVDASSTASTNDYAASSVTTSTTNQMLVAVYCSPNGMCTFTAPAGMTAGYSGGQNCTSTAIFHGIQAAKGDSGPKTAKPSVSGAGSAFLIALKCYSGSS